jgi:PilZ domain-containing protein
MNVPAEDPRRLPRARVFVAATLECAGEALPVVLRDLSELGALVRLEAILDVDSEVRLHRDGLAVHGYVAWVHDGYAGIVFSRPLEAEVVLRQIDQLRPGTWVEEQCWTADRPVRRNRRK